MLMHILKFFEGDLRTEPAWKVKFAHLVPLHTVSTYSREQKQIMGRAGWPLLKRLPEKETVGNGDVAKNKGANVIIIGNGCKQELNTDQSPIEAALWVASGLTKYSIYVTHWPNR